MRKFLDLLPTLMRRWIAPNRRHAEAPVETLGELTNFLRRAKPGEEYTFEYLVNKVHPSSPEALAAALAFLVDKGILTQVVRVESPSAQGGIKDYPSIQAIPDEIHDWRAGEDIAVKPEYLRVIYFPVCKNLNSPSLVAP